MEGRSRRERAPKRGAAALAALTRLRGGGGDDDGADANVDAAANAAAGASNAPAPSSRRRRQLDDFEVKDADAVYDVVDEDEYADLVAKRRREGGGFVVDDDGGGYVDIGEEDDWSLAADGAEEAAGKGGKGKQAMKDAAAEDRAGKKQKKKAAGGAASLPLPAAQRQRIAKMFSAAAAASGGGAGGGGPSSSSAAAGAAARGKQAAASSAAAADPAAADALLDDILGDIDEPATAAAKPKAGGAARKNTASAAAPVAFAAPPPPRPSAAALRAASLAKVEAAEPAAVEAEEQEEQEEGQEEEPQSAVEGMEVEEPSAAPAVALHPAAARIKAEAGASRPRAPALGTPAAAANKKSGAVAAAAAASSAAAVVTPYRTPAPAVPAAEDPLDTPATGAPAAGWAAQYDDLGAEVVVNEAGGEDEKAAAAAAAAPSSPSSFVPAAAPLSDDAPLPLEKDGSLPFFLLDAHEEWATPGVVYLFGKVPLTNASTSSNHNNNNNSPAATTNSQQPQQQRFVSCCAVVKNAHRSVVFVPREPLFGADDEASNEVDALEHELAAARAEGGEAGAARAGRARPALLRALHAAASDLKAEVRALLTSLGVKSFTLKPVRRSYPGVGAPPAAARTVARSMGWGSDNAGGGGWAIKARFPASSPLLPVGLSGTHFAATFGGNQSALEALLVKRKVKGAVWLKLGGGSGTENNNNASSSPSLPPLRRVAAAQQVSWCALEVELSAGPKAVSPAPDDGWGSRPPPPLTVAAVKVTAAAAPAGGSATKTSGNGGANEILALSVVHLRDSVPCDRPLTKAAWSPPSSASPSSNLKSFTILRRVEPGKPFPPGLDAAVARANASAAAAAAAAQQRRKRSSSSSSFEEQDDGPALSALPTEKALLSAALARLRALDADVLLGHNAAAFDLELLLHRSLQLGVPQWSRLGRLRRNKPPRASSGGGGSNGGPGGGGASPQLVTALAGRLLCDTYLSSRELVREVDYTLTTMARSLLGQARSDLPPAAVRAAFDDPRGGAEKLLRAARHAEGDAWLSLGLAATLNVLPLTRALACLSGSLWSRALLGQRAGRIEMLLLHELRARKMLLPDRWSAKDRERLLSEANGGGSGGESSSKGPQYSGGLVLEPKKGLYESFVLLLDFNSLYPSIIQEYNLCWTTVDCTPPPAVMPAGGEKPAASSAVLPPPPASEAELAVLPTVIRGLVARRRAVKDLLRSERDQTRRAQLDLRQQALKLTANSMYGCLGFGASRFHARALAELVTSQGREVLQSTVDLVRSGVGADVIYGDTDSIMVSAGASDLPAALQLGTRIKREVNKRYRTLEIELDGVYSRMLLLKKKKYAAVKVEPGKVAADGVSPVLTREAKGLDIVRRDWCPLAKDAGSRALDAILGGSGNGGGAGAGNENAAPSDDVVGSIHDALRDVAAKCAAGAVPLHKFVITKQLTRRPEDYPDASNQPHVQVALRRKARGDARDATQQGETVPYIICVDGPGMEKPENEAGSDGNAAAENNNNSSPASSSLAGLPLASRAFHPDEVRASLGRLAVDLEYYLGNQVLPVVSRLCAPIEGACDAGQLAECLGLDSAKYKSSSNGPSSSSLFGGSLAAAAREAAMLGGGPWLDDDARFESCPKLLLKAPNAANSKRVFAFVGAEAVASGEVEAEKALEIPSTASTQPHRLTAAQLANAAALACRRVLREYYDSPAVSDDELAPAATRDVSLRLSTSSSSSSSSTSPSGSLPADPTSSARMHRSLPEAEAYARLSALWRSLDPARAAAAAERKAEAAAAKGGAPPAVAGEAALRLSPIARELQAAADVAARARDAAAYRWVNVAALFAC